MAVQRDSLCPGGVVVVHGRPVQAQLLLPTQSGSSSSSGLGILPQTNLMGSSLGQSGMMVLPMPMYATTGSKTATTGTASTLAADPLGLGFVYGPAAIPMNQGQAGLFMLSTATRSLGMGTGQLSGVRPGNPQSAGAASRGRTAGHAAENRVIAAHTRNSNIPGGQAARYFNRGTTAGTGSRSQPFFKRQLHQFPQSGQ